MVIGDVGNELPHAVNIPTYAADAWYHGVLAPEYQGMELEAFLEQVRGFVEDEYVPALFWRSRFSEEERNALAEKLAGYTGLDKEYVLSSNLRIAQEDFAVELLKDKKLAVGRYDGRITGPVTGTSMSDGQDDPSGSPFDLSFGNAFNNYVISELGFQTDRTYIPSAIDINRDWALFHFSCGENC